MKGNQRIGACGHIQEAVFNQMYLCLGAPDCVGLPRCPKCGTLEVEPFVAESLPPGSWHCLPNGHCWFRG